MLEPATLAECERVLAQLPDLTAPGFDSHYAARHERKNARRTHEGLPPEVRRPPTPITDPDVRWEISIARLFIREMGCPRKTINRKRSSCGLKHEAERYMGAYISNGAFIAAAYLEGYAIEREGPNTCLSLNFTSEYWRVLRGWSNAAVPALF
jgi:hypothetical protein